MQSPSRTDRAATRRFPDSAPVCGVRVDAAVWPPAGLRIQQRRALLAMAFLFPLGGATFAVPWVLGLRIWQLISGRHLGWVRSPLDFPVAGFLLLALIAGVRSPLPTVALGTWFLAVLLFGVVLQVVLNTLRDAPDFVQSLHKASAFGMACAAVYGLLVLYILHPSRAYLMLFGGSALRDAAGNALGFGLMAGIFLTLPLLRNRAPWPRISAFVVALATAGLVGTLSRGALYGLAAGGITFFCLEVRRLPLRVLMISMFCLALGLTAALSTPLIMKPLAVQIASRLHLQAPLQESRILDTTLRFLVSKESNGDRLLIWHAAVQVIRNHPWFGVGLGVFPFVVHQSAPEIPPGTPPHSIYLEMGTDVGIPGAVAFLAIPVIAILWGLKQRNPYRHGQVAAMVGMMAADIRDHILMMFHMALGFVLILAMLLAPVEEKEQAGSRSS